MCDEHEHWEWNGHFATSEPIGITRRNILKAAVLGTGALAISGLRPGAARATAPASPSADLAGMDGLPLYRTAQHIHARGSEGPASMAAQASEASKWVDVMWFTDHDWREAGIGAPTVVHFTSLDNELLPPNAAWLWVRRDAGSLDTSSDGGIETVDVSPADPDPGGALFARAVAASDNPASVSFYADDGRLRNSMRTPVHGQSWDIDVLLREGSRDGWGFLRVQLSYHPAGSGRPDAYYFIEYRFGPFNARSYSVESLSAAAVGPSDGGDGGKMKLRPGEQALVGVVTVPVKVGTYSTQRLTFTDDIQTLFPGMIARDNSVHGLWLGATAENRASANVCFDYLRMTRVTGQAQFEDRRSITRSLAETYPNLVMYNGTELSYQDHRQWLGGDIALPDYGDTQRAQPSDRIPASDVVKMIVAGGGLAVANHPYGTNGPKLSDSEAATTASAVVSELIKTSAEGGLKGIEIFYRSRAGASLEQHWRLYRLAVRNGLVLTASGVSDNHWGRADSWREETNRFTTNIFAADRSEKSLLAAQSAGRAFAAEIGTFAGALDIALDSDVMGQIAVRPRRVTGTLTVTATDVPADGCVEVWKVPVDLGGVTGEPGGVVAQIPAGDFSGGLASLEVDTTSDCAYAVMVLNAKGRRVAGSNPVWHLRAEPTQWAIPEDRRAG